MWWFNLNYTISKEKLLETNASTINLHFKIKLHSILAIYRSPSGNILSFLYSLNLQDPLLHLFVFMFTFLLLFMFLLTPEVYYSACFVMLIKWRSFVTSNQTPKLRSRRTAIHLHHISYSSAEKLKRVCCAKTYNYGLQIFGLGWGTLECLCCTMVKPISSQLKILAGWWLTFFNCLI